MSVLELVSKPITVPPQPLIPLRDIIKELECLADAQSTARQMWLKDAERDKGTAMHSWDLICADSALRRCQALAAAIAMLRERP